MSFWIIFETVNFSTNFFLYFYKNFRLDSAEVRERKNLVNITQDSFQDQNSATESTEATQETAKTAKDFDIGPPQGNIFRIYIQGCTCIVGKGIEEIWNEIGKNGNFPTFRCFQLPFPTTCIPFSALRIVNWLERIHSIKYQVPCIRLWLLIGWWALV